MRPDPAEVLPESDFPESCRDLYPADFRYPEGYLARPNRVTDRAMLMGYEPWLRPYVVRHADGEVAVDGGSPVPVRRLARGPLDTSVKSALRYLEHDGPPDEPLSQTFALEDKSEYAELYSEAGRHEESIRMIRAMPQPFQRTMGALKALVRSLKSLGRYEEALEEVVRLIANEEITEYYREMCHIERAELLMHCERDTEAAAILDEKRSRLQLHWSYYGVRAALALRAGDEGLARSLILRAGRVNAYHAYKLLWNRHLAPLAPYIRRELLTDDGKPRLYERDVAMRRLSHGIHGAILTGEVEHARNLAEGLIMHQVTDWDSADQFVLALAGLGCFDWMLASATVMPGNKLGSLKLARAVARAAQDPAVGDEAVRARMDDSLFSPDGERDFCSLLPWLIGAEAGPPPPLRSCLVCDVGRKRWTDEGRDRFVVSYDSTRGFEARKVFEDGSLLRPGPRELLAHFPVLELTRFPDATAFEVWLEARMEENMARKGEFIPYEWTVEMNGWALASLLNPDRTRTPLVSEAAEIARRDPSFYFSNGPACTFGMRTSFGDKLAHMLRGWLGTRGERGD